MKISVIALSLWLATAQLAFAQASDPGAERARIANERILAEAERREREEREAEAAAARAAASAAPTPAPTQPAPAATSVPPAQLSPAPAPMDMQQVLEQLKSLGELRDAGYLSEAEFSELKRRILQNP